jgi:arabinogalactan endo-1,4-beta-galactosidase
MAERIKDLYLKFLLDFHYSDTWADPGHQIKPVSWQNLNFQILKDSVYQYTRNVITALKNQNTIPDMVQIGNEITCGMLWDDGRVCGQYNTPQQWTQLAELINEGIRGVKESLDPGDTVSIMIHIDRGGDNAGSQWFFDNLLANNVNFDIIGLSYYPWWHGTLDEVELNINDLAQRYDKEIIIVETAYPWTLTWYDTTNNIVGDSSQLHQGYPASIDGQKSFIIDLIDIVRNVQNNRGIGIFYWAPEYISVPQLGSPWENLTLFDFTGELLSSIEAFDSTLSYLAPPNRLTDSFHLYQNYPNPFNSTTTINYEIQNHSYVVLKIYDLLGQMVGTLVNEYQSAGRYSVAWNGSEEDGQSLSSGLYIYSLQINDTRQWKKMLLLR